MCVVTLNPEVIIDYGFLMLLLTELVFLLLLFLYQHLPFSQPYIGSYAVSSGPYLNNLNDCFSSLASLVQYVIHFIRVLTDKGLINPPGAFTYWLWNRLFDY